MQALEPRRLARDDRHRALGHAEMLGDQRHQRRIGRAVDRRGGQARGEMILGPGGQHIAPAAWRHPDRDLDPVVTLCPGGHPPSADDDRAPIHLVGDRGIQNLVEDDDREQHDHRAGIFDRIGQSVTALSFASTPTPIISRVEGNIDEGDIFIYNDCYKSDGGITHLPDICITVPVFVAGGIGRGEVMVSFLEMGAAGVQMGTRFVCASECIAHPKFKKAFIRASARDAMPTVQLDKKFPVIPVRALINRGTEEFMNTQGRVAIKFANGELDQQSAQLEIEHFWAGALRRAVIDGDVEFGSLMAGQSVGMVKREEPASHIINELLQQATAALMLRAAQ